MASMTLATPGGDATPDGRRLTGNWEWLARCSNDPQNDPELFFPFRPAEPTREQDKAYRAEVRNAKRYCGRCPVRAQCLQEALETLAKCPPVEGAGRGGVRGGVNLDNAYELKKAPQTLAFLYLVQDWENTGNAPRIPRPTTTPSAPAVPGVPENTGEAA